ncbi:MAG: bifunctional sugar-1-phosphate nucleotidylyltransferase/acetyltransferase [Candidatus Levyibacteriota bacterium]
MQVVILAAGKSSRFYPYTNLKHKSLIKFMGMTLLEHTIISIRETGIKDIIIVVGTDPFIQDLLGNGEQFKVKITYVTQPEPLGMGDALIRAEEYIKDYFFLLNAHHMDFADFKAALEAKKGRHGEIVFLAKRDGRLHKYGFLNVQDDRVLDIVEKPSRDQAPSEYRVIGIYLLHKNIFPTLHNTVAEEYSFEHALSHYAKEAKATMVLTDKPTVSLKYPWDLFEIADYLLDGMPNFRGKNIFIAKNAILEGDIFIEDDVTIFEGACIKGPCYIGRGAVIGNNAIVRSGSVIGDNALVGANLELKHTILMDASTAHSGFIGDSIIGENCRIAAGVTTGNVRMDRQVIHSVLNEKKVETGRRSMGVIMGDSVRTGINISTMPGIIIGNNAIIGPSTTLMENV